MRVEYIEFDLDSAGRGLLNLVYEDSASDLYYLETGVYFSQKLCIDWLSCRLIACIDS